MAGYKFDYETKVWGGEILRLAPTHFRCSRLFWALLALKKSSGKLLDVGCGAGDFSEAISFYRPDLAITGIDISKKAVSIAKKRKTKIDFRVADAQKIPFQNGTFNAVVCFDLIEHVERPIKTLSEIQRVLKRGGILQTFIPTEGNLFTLEGFLIKLGWKAKEIYGAHPHHFSYGEIKKMLVKSGFRIKQVKWGDHLIHQLIELGYFTFLSIRGKNLGRSVEGYLSGAKPNLVVNILKVFKNMLAIISNTETLLFFWFPALGVHITAEKK